MTHSEPPPPSPGDGQGVAARQAASLPVLLEAVLSVGSELELRTTLQHIVDSATELCAARYGALGVPDGRRRDGAQSRGGAGGPDAFVGAVAEEQG
ncbi:hypothetical protein ACWCP2_27675, partial [Streptomyces sp. NPDC002104]